MRMTEKREVPLKLRRLLRGANEIGRRTVGQKHWDRGRVPKRYLGGEEKLNGFIKPYSVTSLAKEVGGGGSGAMLPGFSLGYG